MLQILLAVIGVTMAAAVGYIMVEQVGAQQSISTSREDNRRLDAAADLLMKNLISAPTLDTLIAPVGVSGSSGGYSQLGPLFNMVRTNSQGVPFLYCPIASRNQENDIDGEQSSTVNTSDGNSYSVKVANGGVVQSSVTLDSTVAALNPVAIITSANGNRSAPPTCSSVRMQNGKVTVAGGLARVITLPTNTVSTKNANTQTALYYVTQDGAGKKTGASFTDAMPAETLWATIGKYKPGKVTIVGGVGVVNLGSNFLSFINGSNGKSTELYFYSGEYIFPASSSYWSVGNKITFQGSTVTVPKFEVDVGGQLTFRSLNVVKQNAFTGNMFSVLSGGALAFDNASVVVDYNNQSHDGVIWLYGGTLSMNTSALTTRNGTPNHYLVAATGGRADIRGSYIGINAAYGNNNAGTPLYLIGSTARISFSGNDNHVLKGLGQYCGLGVEGAEGFNWINTRRNEAVTGVWPTSGNNQIYAPPEAEYAEPAASDSQAVWAQYAEYSGRRRLSREQFVGAFNCRES